MSEYDWKPMGQGREAHRSRRHNGCVIVESAAWLTIRYNEVALHGAVQLFAQVLTTAPDAQACADALADKLTIAGRLVAGALALADDAPPIPGVSRQGWLSSVSREEFGDFDADAKAVRP